MSRALEVNLPLSSNWASSLVVEIETKSECPVPIRHMFYSDGSHMVDFYSAFVARTVGDGT